jgi:hypothetical protein
LLHEEVWDMPDLAVRIFEDASEGQSGQGGEAAAPEREARKKGGGWFSQKAGNSAPHQ